MVSRGFAIARFVIFIRKCGKRHRDDSGSKGGLFKTARTPIIFIISASDMFQDRGHRNGSGDWGIDCKVHGLFGRVCLTIVRIGGTSTKDITYLITNHCPRSNFGGTLWGGEPLQSKGTIGKCPAGQQAHEQALAES